MKWNASSGFDALRRRGLGVLLSACALGLAGCANTVTSSANLQSMEPQARWALLPLVNNTEAPMAALAAEAVVEHHMLARGVAGLVRYPASLARDQVVDSADRKLGESAEKWAREQGLRYALTGSVEEWRYKAGLDGEPAIGLTLRVIDLESGRVAWTASGARAGWGRDSLSAVAQRLVQDLLATLPLRGSARVKADGAGG